MQRDVAAHGGNSGMLGHCRGCVTFSFKSASLTGRETALEGRGTEVSDMVG